MIGVLTMANLGQPMPWLMDNHAFLRKSKKVTMAIMATMPMRAWGAAQKCTVKHHHLEFL